MTNQINKPWDEQTKQEKFETLTAYIKRLEKEFETLTEKWDNALGRERNKLNDRRYAVKAKIEKTQKRLEWYR